MTKTAISRYSADVKHEVTQVTSGYRWVLTYNLVHSEHIAQPLTIPDTRFLRAVLEKWRGDIVHGTSPHRLLVYLLDHQYTDDSLRYSTLKGRDLVKARLLERTCEQTDYCLYLANLERRVWGSAEEDDGGYYGSHYYDYGSEGDSSEEDDGADNDDHYKNSMNGPAEHEIIDVCDESLTLTRVIDLKGKVVGTRIDIAESDIVQ